MSRDPLDKLFESLDPLAGVSDAELFNSGKALERLHREIGGFDDVRRHGLLWRRSILISIAMVTVAAGTAVALTLTRAPVEQVATLSCFQGSSLKSTVEIVPYSGDPLGRCDMVWHHHLITGGVAPRGSLCVLKSGSLAAFPPEKNLNTCAELGLPTFNGKIRNPRFAEFQTTALSYFRAHSCVPPGVAALEVRTLIGRFGLIGWSIRLAGERSSKSCAFPAFQETKKQVLVVGNPIHSR